MAYHELIKNFNKVQDYIREFYVYGFKSRGEVGYKSARTYDDIRRRIESWLGEYMSFTQSPSGKTQFISVDSRNVVHNPLYQAFKTSTFSQNDVLLHFFLLDFMEEKTWLSIREILDKLQDDYFNYMQQEILIDERTVRNKLNAYAKLGILQKTKGTRNQDFYALAENKIDLASWKDAIEFFAEVGPLGVIGSCLLDKKELALGESSFWYKHHYILFALESEIVESILEGISNKKYIEVTLFKNHKNLRKEVYPVKIYVSTQNGREYLLCYYDGRHGLSFIRLDNIKSVQVKEVCENYQDYDIQYRKSKPYIWGAVVGSDKSISHVEITIRVGKKEDFILQRLNREKRNGRVCKINDITYKYVVDTYDAMELVPWIRTFIGRILKIESDNPELEKLFRKDLEELYDMYLGGEGDAVS